MADSDEYRAFIRKRGSVKARLTNFAKHLDRCRPVLDDVQIVELSERLTKTQQVIDEFNDIQTSIENLTNDVDEQYNLRDEFEQEYYSAISRAKTLLSNNQRINTDIDNQGAVGSHVSLRGSNLTTNSVKLPTIQLPNFEGSYEHWLEYRDTFESLIHNNESINQIQKFHYLRASLSGNASQVIKSIEFSANNYTIAWEVLCDRFNNHRLLVYNHVKMLMELEPIGKESPEKIRKLIDNVSKHLRALNQLNQPTDQWDTLIIYMITTKLDTTTSREWEQKKAGNDLPTLNDLKQFLKNRADLLETLELNSNEKPKVQRSRSHVATTTKCPICNHEHFIYRCDELKKMSVENRIDRVKRLKLCINCLRGGHFAKDCQSGTCRMCSSKHNTLLHLKKPADTDTSPRTNNENAITRTYVVSNTTQQVILSTACVQVFDNHGNTHLARALLDSGSQSSFITTELYDRLQLKRTKLNISVAGLNNLSSSINFKCNLKIKSRCNKFATDLTCLIMREITGELPNIKIDPIELNIPESIELADPQFSQPGRVDILIGADLFWRLICNGQINSGRNKPTLQNTRLGWVVSGPMHSQYTNKMSCNFSKTVDVNDQIERFWKIEECPSSKTLSPEEQECENRFAQTTKRDENGRFIVQIPLKTSPSKLGESKERAFKRLVSLERKLQLNPDIRIQYEQFMNEYEAQNHMTELNPLNDESEVSYYMPHHCVLRESVTTKLRVVFDASAKTTNDLSLNDIQLVGPTIQSDLLSIILRFRQHRYVFSADVAKMYRQVLITPEQRSLQRILWRSSPSNEIKTYTLNTVTYGTASAPFLAIRSLCQLADDCSESQPDIAQIIRRDFYVDDLLTGADTIKNALRIRNSVTDALKQGCFELRKFRANNPEITQRCETAAQDASIDLVSNQNTKTLGLLWNCETDSLLYAPDISSTSDKINKRNILSSIAQIFDPLGLLSPCIITAKILMQKLWLEKLSWDDIIPRNLSSDWITFRTELPTLRKLAIPRHAIIPNPKSIELHGFSDASESAYGACIYLRSIDQSDNSFVNILCAKSKVAPLKTLTMPRLELCGALVLARLMQVVRDALTVEITSTHCWTDSTIVLGWLKTAPNLLKTFVNSRVAEVQDLTKTCIWHHVPTKSNPADLLSRGVSPSQIANLDLWWHGPQWLAKESSQWPPPVHSVAKLPELKNETKCLTNHDIVPTFPFERFSSLIKAKRVMAYIMRFKTNCSISKDRRQVKPLSVDELDQAFKLLIKLSQRDSFPRELKLWTNQGIVGSKGSLLNLTPIIDSDGLLRVGGRLSNSNYPFDKKHPIIIHSSHYLTKLIFSQEHKILLHAGPQQLLASIRERFWPIAGRNLAKKTVRLCVKCARYNPIQLTPRMGELPSTRVTVQHPFTVSGVDYAGPFYIKDRKGRGAKLQKCWIAVFVCFVTKAIHLETVLDLSTEAFILALRRFTSRRGKPSHVYSDNGTNFVGASHELDRLGKWLCDSGSELIDHFADEGIKWHFIPAHSPHFGGIWEAGVKSVKHHLRRVMGDAHLTHDQFYSLLVQIEAILNSRPLFPLSADPSDLSPLTPAHFLVGRPLTAVPDPDLRDIKPNRLSHYQHVQVLRQHFWERWSKEYLSELQQRTRWKQTHQELKEGTLVLIKEDNSPPMKWRLGRVISLHPGQDAITRVASVKTSGGIIKRALVKLCPLPIDIERCPFQGGGHVQN